MIEKALIILSGEGVEATESELMQYATDNGIEDAWELASSYLDREE